MSETPKLKRFYNNYKGQIMTYGVLIAMSVILIAVVIPKFRAENSVEVQRERAQKILIGRKTAAEARYRLPTGPADGLWYLCVEEDYFLCSHVTLIPLENRTTIINEYGYYKDAGDHPTVHLNIERLPQRCWTDDRNTFTETSFYEFSDVTCLVVADYQRHKNMDHDTIISWQQTAADAVPTDWKELN